MRSDSRHDSACFVDVAAVRPGTRRFPNLDGDQNDGGNPTDFHADAMEVALAGKTVYHRQSSEPVAGWRVPDAVPSNISSERNRRMKHIFTALLALALALPAV